MGRFGVVTCAIVLVAVWALAQEKEAVDSEFPPRVVKTEPADRAKDVDYRLAEVKVTFDRPMQTEKAWSWMLLQENGVYPGYRGGAEPRWEADGKTCVISVKLSPDTVYAVGVNSPRNWGFRGQDGKAAVPYGWVFKTRK
ncbi:MAG: hypothetical protein FJ272_06550 [Planctomycetes bacterium]|nr:hypothetical protein [Planctomycetota bacterium]